MGYRKVKYTELEYFNGATDNRIPAGNTVTLEWQSGPDLDGDAWPASTPAAPTTSFNLNGTAYRAKTLVGGVSPASGTITIDLLINGAVVTTTTFDPGAFWLVELKTPLYPRLVQGTNGHSVAVRVVNNTSGPLEVSTSGTENDLHLEAEEFYPTDPITSEDLCNEIAITNNRNSPTVDRVREYASTTLGNTRNYNTLGQPWNLGFLASGIRYVAESIIDSKNIIQRFSSTGTSLGEWINLTGTYSVTMNNPMGIFVDEAEVVWVLAWVSTDLTLFKFDSSATLLDSWVVESDGGVGAELTLQIATDDKAYYTEQGVVDGSGNASLRCFDTVTAAQGISPLTLTADDYFGAFILFPGAQGGAAISRSDLRFNAFRQTWIDLYDSASALIGQIPTEDGDDPLGAYEDPLQTNAVCLGENSLKLWYGIDATRVMHKVDLSTFIVSSTIDIGVVEHHGVASCTTQGIGFIPSAAMFPVVTLMGAT